MGSLFSPLQRSKSEYLRVNLGESNTGTSFPVHQPPQPGLALDDAVRHSHLAAQSRQENHELKRERVCVCVLYHCQDMEGCCSWPGLWQLLSVKKLVLLFIVDSGEEIHTSWQGQASVLVQENWICIGVLVSWKFVLKCTLTPNPLLTSSAVVQAASPMYHGVCLPQWGLHHGQSPQAELSCSLPESWQCWHLKNKWQKSVSSQTLYLSFHVSITESAAFTAHLSWELFISIQ